MNEIRRSDRQADEIARIRAIVERHKLPDFVTGFDVRLGEFDGDPAMWISFHTVGDRPTSEIERRERANALRQLRERVHRDLLAEIEDRYPYYRFTHMDLVVPSPP